MATLDVHQLEPLLRRALAGDGQALNDLFARLRKYMHHRVREELGAGPDGRIDWSVLVQSACRRAFVHFPELEAPNVPRLLRWVATIVKNRVRDELRRLARQPVDLLGSGIVALADLRPHGASAGRAELAAQVAAALARLPDRERRVVETRWFDPQPDEDTARELNITVNHVHQLRFRALEKLRELLPPAWEACP
jgi:RNA polymerase sigma-70 factor (ECF subfamily)